MCLIGPVLAAVTVTDADCWMEFFASTPAVAVYVVVAGGVTVALCCGNTQGLHTVLPAPSDIESEVAVPPVTFQDSRADVPDVIVAGDAVKLRVNGIVTVTV